MIRTLAPKNARSKRALAERAPKAVENPKKVLLLRGTSSSELIQSVLSSLNSLKKPFTLKFTKKNAVHPFEDAAPLEFFSQKNDCAFLCVGSHSKKRPHNLVVARMFDHRLLDMVEFGVDPDTFRSVENFKGVEKPAVGMKPMLLFTGDVWEKDERFQRIRSLWMDFFRGEEIARVDVEGLQYVVSFAAKEGENKLHMRCFMIRTKRAGGGARLPRVEVEEMGPRLDLTIRREERGSEELWKEALRKPKGVKPKTKKNIDMDIMGDKIGRIHTGKQELNKMQSRKMKGLKKRAADDSDDEDAEIMEDDDSDGGVPVEDAPKSKKKARRE
ncbi:Brix-domain-containing protein [Ascodesmis nigricans]|uniref:Ribosome production factor 2 homolog n=1 Tax=Ascodesmis nigricans TaxID=341454 RepID=A0A4S2N7R6_9PEZI|nr:Brix-domain-containing protein [Ascodesmis nigricans]